MRLLTKLLMRAGGAGLPQSASIVFKLSADSLVLSNGASVSSWIDSANGATLTASGGAQPTFQTNQLGGKPCVRFNGTANTMAMGRPTALAAAIDSQNYTVLVAAKVTGAAGGGFGGVFSCWNSTGLMLSLDGTKAGIYQDNLRAPLATSTFAIVGGSSQDNPAWGSGTGLSRTYVNATCVASTPAKGTATGGNNFAIGSNPAPGQFFNGDLFEVLVWNTALTPAEIYQVQKYLCDKYTQTYPWYSASFITLHDGDSITEGYLLSDLVQSYPYQAAVARTLTYGQWSNLGVPGQKMTNMAAKSAEFAAISSITGKQVRVASWEYANERGTAPATLQAGLVSYCNTVRGYANTKLVLGTSTSTNSDPDGGNRATYNSYIVTNSATLCDARVDLHNDTSIGISGAAATDANVTYFIDGLHLKQAGHAIQASLFNAGLTSF